MCDGVCAGFQRPASLPPTFHPPLTSHSDVDTSSAGVAGDSTAARVESGAGVSAVWGCRAASAATAAWAVRRIVRVRLWTRGGCVSSNKGRGGGSMQRVSRAERKERSEMREGANVFAFSLVTPSPHRKLRAAARWAPQRRLGRGSLWVSVWLDNEVMCQGKERIRCGVKTGLCKL